MAWNRFTDEAKAAILRSQLRSQERGSRLVEPEDILAGVLEVRAEDGFFETMKPVRRALWKALQEIPTDFPNSGSDPMELSRRGKRVIDLTLDAARRLNSEVITPELLVIGMLMEGKGDSFHLLQRHGVRTQVLLEWHADRSSLLRPADGENIESLVRPAESSDQSEALLRPSGAAAKSTPASPEARSGFKTWVDRWTRRR